MYDGISSKDLAYGLRGGSPPQRTKSKVARMTQNWNQGEYNDDFKEWLEETRNLRHAEMSFLEAELQDEANEEISFESLTPRHREEIRLRHEDMRRIWDLERRLRELIRWEREDLEWEWKLKSRSRQMGGNFYRSTSTEHQETKQNGDRRSINPQPGKKNRQHRKRSHKARTVNTEDDSAS